MKKILSLVLAALMLLAVLPASAQEEIVALKDCGVTFAFPDALNESAEPEQDLPDEEKDAPDGEQDVPDEEQRRRAAELERSWMFTTMAPLSAQEVVAAYRPALQPEPARMRPARWRAS